MDRSYARLYYQDTGRRPYLYYAVIGIDGEAELEISRSTLQEYLKGKGNPSIKTIIHLSQKLEIEPAVLLTGMTEVEARNVVRPLLNAVRSISELNNDKKLRLAELFWEMVRLWADE